MSTAAKLVEASTRCATTGATTAASELGPVLRRNVLVCGSITPGKMATVINANE